MADHKKVQMNVSPADMPEMFEHEFRIKVKTSSKSPTLAAHDVAGLLTLQLTEDLKLKPGIPVVGMMEVFIKAVVAKKD